MANKQQKTSKLQWFHQNRIKIALLTILVVIPISLIIIAYAGTYAAYKKVSFQDLTDENLSEITYIKDFKDIDELDYINLSVDWKTLKNPVFNDDDSIDTGYYHFNITYEAKDTYDVTKVVVTPVLQTNWVNYRSLGTASTLTPSNSFLITFNYELPVRKLLFIEVTDPILYLKVDITYDTANETIEQTQYVAYTLDDKLPESVQ